MKINPLVIVLREARRDGETPSNALMLLMMAVQGSREDTAIPMCAVWDLEHGEPSWEKMEAWAERIFNEPANKSFADTLRARHDEEIKHIPAGYLEELMAGEG